MLVNSTVIKGVRVQLELYGYRYFVRLKDRDGHKAVAECRLERGEYRLKFKDLPPELDSKADWRKIVEWVNQSIHDRKNRERKRNIGELIKEQIKHGPSFNMDL